MRNLAVLFKVLLAVCLPLTVVSQIIPPIEPPPAFNIDVNAATRADIYTIFEGAFGLVYFDRYGVSKTIPLKIYNQRNEQVAAFALEKSLGMNTLTVNLKNEISIRDGDQYFCVVTDEKQEVHEWFIKQLPKKKSELTVDLFINPIRLNCSNDLEVNSVEFYGNISKGKGPFTVNWYVLNDSRTDFLYQPQELILEQNGETPVIIVDKSPGYYVIFDVKDGCETRARKIVYMQCQPKKKKANTVFIEPGDFQDTLPKPGN